MNITPEVVEEILNEQKRLKSPYKVARSLGLDINVVWEIIDANSDRLQPYSERYGGLGRPELQKYIVARRRATDREWDNSDPDIVRARQAYEAGTHDMATGRDGAWLILYSIPRRRPDPRPNHFAPEF